MSDIAGQLKKYRLSKDEYDLASKLVGHPLAGLEWALFSALWSEHCSYKSSKVHLKKFAFKSPRVLQSMGENAGVIDLGMGEKVAFKMESHNHPSFIEPYQGAATGVGGILRDIFTMGARPIGLANYLCFGEPKAPRMAALVDGVVAGIAGYGNCVGVPTITGQTEFHSSYNNNILVNALAVGLFTESDPVVTSQAHGVGNLVVYVGAKTGRDGVHGASMASESFASDSESKRPTVQIGDPFFEKLLIESCIEVMQKDLVVAIQDMGAAGLTSSSFEMAAKGGVGFRIHLDKVPLRDTSVGPEEILLSESQERMLLICEPAKFEAVKKVFEHWALEASVLGEVTKGPDVELFWKGERLVAMDPKILTDNAPQYDRKYKAWTPHSKKTEVKAVDGLLPRALESIEGTSRRWVYEQYDQRVGAKTVRDCEDSVSVLRLPSGRGLGLVLGCRPHVMRVDARLGGLDAAIYPALELAAKGFEPLAVTDCLNFGNPEKENIMSEFVASVEALAEVTKALDAPVISGNVSFYNETLSENITSTPATGMVGIRPNVEKIPASHFAKEGDSIFLWRLPGVKLVGDFLGQKMQWSGELDVTKLTSFVKALTETTRSARIQATRLSGKMGLQYALYRMCHGDLSATVDGPVDFAAENLYEIICVGEASLESTLQGAASASGSEILKIGTVTRGPLKIGRNTYDLNALHRAYREGWRTHFGSLA